MQSIWAGRTTRYCQTRIHPALASFADECCGTLARLIVYVGTLAVAAIFGLHLWHELPAIEIGPIPPAPGWSVATRARPAFAVSQFDLPEKTETYVVLRHPLGGRKDILRWSAKDRSQGGKLVAELEIYRPGGELGRSGPAIAQIAARMDPDGGQQLETDGVIDSKFGTVTLLRAAGSAGQPRSCLGFLRRIDQPRLQISGWSCQGDILAVRRAAIGCLVSRLVLLTAGNEPELAEFFARAEPKRGGCAVGVTAADWMTTADSPALRGAL
jgi:hypothetical protein